MNKGLLVSLPILVVAAVGAQVALTARRPVSTSSLEESAFAAFGGLRALAAEVVWFRADRLQDEGRYVELAELARALTLAEPHTPEVWGYAAWNLAYNVSVMMPTHEDRWRWVSAAIRLLRDDGLRINPDSAMLHRELAWLFELKLGANLDAAAPTYRAKWAERVRDVAARGAWDELGMEPMLMTEVEAKTGFTDREDPLYSAVYWAYRGHRRAKTAAERALLGEIIRQSLIIRSNQESRKGR